MLQQTRVQTVIPFYERFMKRFPTVAALASAAEDEVMSYWSGLGYYRRARLLHQGAKAIALEHDGVVPRDPAQRLRVPGVGRYTSGAIGSIAFDLPEPIVDGNVARVLSRVFCIDAPLATQESNRALWQHAATLVQGPDPGDFNQALMELGATVCLPSRPQCLLCPIRTQCAAHKSGMTETLPRPKIRKPPTALELSAVVASAPKPKTSKRARRDETALWLLRENAALYGGLWVLPTAEGGRSEHAAQALAMARLQGQLSDEPAGTVTHTLTHRQLTVRVWRARDVDLSTTGTPPSDAVKVWSLDELGNLGISRLTQKIIAKAFTDWSVPAQRSRHHNRPAATTPQATTHTNPTSRIPTTT
jgi:A/G-specific adenine glycosylase